jgi:hypothetical protein
MLGRRGNDQGKGSTRIGQDTEHGTGTAAGADVTSRMAGVSGRHGGADETAVRGDGGRPGMHGVATDTDSERYEQRARVLPAKTSAAAVFALVFGLASLFCALTAILAPAAVLFGLVGLLLGILGRRMAGRPGVTGKGVAVGGLLTALLGLLLGAAVIAGASVLVNDEQRLDQLQTWIDDARQDLPSGSELVEQVPGS